VLRIIASIPDAMILKSLLPNFHCRAQFFLCSIREATLDELNRIFEARQWRHENMDVVGHDGEFMQKISAISIVIKRVEEKLRPSLVVEKDRRPQVSVVTM
jgi:hypothetical protein